jgi:hypothetical protein
MFKKKRNNQKKMTEHAQILNPLCANMFYSKQNKFYTNNDPGSIKKHSKLNKQAQLDKFENILNQCKISRSSEMTQSDTLMVQQAPFSVDVVFTWVKNTTEHAQKRQYWASRTTTTQDTQVNRFSDHDELRFAIRSIYKNMAWVRNIYIVVDDTQFPSWLSETSANARIPVFVVPHSMLYGDEFQTHLPTFNSHSIECHLHKIPELSSQFIYFNDDMFVGAHTTWTDFFTPQGFPKYIFTGVVPFGKKNSNMTHHTMAWINNGSMLDKVFAYKKDKYRKYPAHQCCPVLKETFQEMWNHDRVKRRLISTSKSKFRNPQNLYPIGLLVYWNLYTNRAVNHHLNTIYADIKDQTSMLQVCRNIIERSPTLFCINDNLVKKRKTQGKLIRFFLNFLFPEQIEVENKPPAKLIKVKKVNPKMDLDLKNKLTKIKSQRLSHIPEEGSMVSALSNVNTGFLRTLF